VTDDEEIPHHMHLDLDGFCPAFRRSKSF